MALIKCPECQKEISSSALSCPHCGYPLGNNVPPTGPDDLPVDNASNPSGSNDNFKLRMVALAILLSSLFVLFLFYNSFLHGDDKAAYDLLLEASYSFKDPSSVRLVSGDYNSIIGLECQISATNSYGATVSSYYRITTDGTVKEIDYPTSSYHDTDSLNVDKINAALAKALP